MTNNKTARDWGIFMNINDERYSDVERMTAIEHIAYAPTHNSITKAMMLDVIRYLLTIDAVPVVRCKDCKHYKDGLCFFTMRRHGLHDDWFCADGEKVSE